jgi:alginate O-acetyltransferase complex protein AlgI
MVFSSYAFILVYLPIVLAIVWLTARLAGARAVIGVLTIASFAFYAYWDWRFLPVLLGSILFNHYMAKLLLHTERHRRLLLSLGIAGNLLCLGYFKYWNFVVANVGLMTGVEFDFAAVVLPIGISFFTFQQIAYLVDVYRERRHDYMLVDYALFVSFFPQLIAGPIVHHKEIMPQLQQPDIGQLRLAMVNRGIIVFVFGLSKKVLIADTLAGYSDTLFAAAAGGPVFSAFEAWGAAATYGLQLYFDFSGYADMAIGLGLLFGIRLPENFNRPYAALSIRDFWRRWHITLSRFLRDYLYIPLGGSRAGPTRAQANLLITMVLGGIWHGAGWTFLAWGALHGSYLIAQRLFETWRMHLGLPPLPAPIAWALTLTAVLFAWVPFRAESFAATLAIWHGMLFMGPLLPGAFSHFIGSTGNDALAFLGLGVAGPAHLSLQRWSWLLPMLLGSLVLAIVLPNGHRAAALLDRMVPQPGLAASRLAGAAVSVLLVASLVYLSHETVFLYFQF